jgi:hypothetical protein
MHIAAKGKSYVVAALESAEGIRACATEILNMTDRYARKGGIPVSFIYLGRK